MWTILLEKSVLCWKCVRRQISNHFLSSFLSHPHFLLLIFLLLLLSLLLLLVFLLLLCQAMFPLVTVLLSISQKTFFLANWHYFLTMCLTNLRVGSALHLLAILFNTSAVISWPLVLADSWKLCSFWWGVTQFFFVNTCGFCAQHRDAQMQRVALESVYRLLW